MSLTRLLTALIAVIGLSLSASPALALDHHDSADQATGAADHGDDHGSHDKHEVVPSGKQALVPLIAAILVFGIVLFLLTTFVWPKVGGALDERANKIRDEIAAAEAARKQAADALNEYEKNLAEARAEAQKMLDETKAKQAEIAAELKAKSDAELQEMRESAKRDIEAAKKAAVGEIHAQATGLATLMAGKILQREVSETDTQALLDESLAQLGGSNN
ncbi:MAG: F0F1 ATP synthase subunit B [Planctomycetota bacterium]